MSICIFGDSIGKGIVLDTTSDKYVSVNFTSMEPLCQEENVNLKNYSMFGCTATKGLSLIQRHTEKLQKDDVVLLEYGGNDCNFLWSEIAAAPEGRHQPNNPPEVFIDAYQKGIEAVQKSGASPVLLTLPPLHAKRFFDWISKGIDKENILRWLGSIDMIYRWQEMYSFTVSMIGKRLCIPVIDIRSAFVGRQDFSELIC